MEPERGERRGEGEERGGEDIERRKRRCSKGRKEMGSGGEMRIARPYSRRGGERERRRGEGEGEGERVTETND